jgi:hypothetical protein
MDREALKLSSFFTYRKRRTFYGDGKSKRLLRGFREVWSLAYLKTNMKIVILDGYTENPGDLSWAPIEALVTPMVTDTIGLRQDSGI